MRNGAWRRRQRCWQWDDLFFWTIHTDLRQATATESLSRKASFCAKHRLPPNTTQAARCRRNACAELRTRFSQRFQGQWRDRVARHRPQREGEEHAGVRWTSWGRQRQLCAAKTFSRGSDNVSPIGREAARQWLCGESTKTTAESGTWGPVWHWGGGRMAGRG